MLLHSAKQPITEENIKKVISAAGIEVEEARVKALVSALSEINIEEALKAAPIAVAPAAAAAPAPQAQAPKEAAKEKEKEEEKKEALEGLSALFG